MDNNTIKYKFLNYKTHRAYAQDLADGKISDESLVFVQDARCIWARGVKYDCNTRVQIEGNTISVLDSDSNVVLSANFATKDEFDSAVSAINDKFSTAKSKNITSAEYVNTSAGNDKQAVIRFKNDNGDVVSTIDVTDFIIDGMIDSVSVVDDHGNKGLKLVFNTDSGREEVVLDIGDLFELDNYYTKNQIDTKESSLQSAINDEIQARATADSALGDRITDEAAARQSADAALNDAIAALQNNLTAGEGIDITNNVISVDDYIGESDINGKLNTLQQMLGQIYVLKRDVSTPAHQWSEAPIYSFGDLPSPSSQETPNRSDILVLNQNAFNTLEQNDELRNDVCYLITD